MIVSHQLLTTLAVAVILTAGQRGAIAQEKNVSALAAITVDDERLPAQITNIDLNWRITFQTDGNSRTLPADQLVKWGAGRDATSAPLVLLADGSLLAVDEVAFGERQLTADSLLWSAATISWKACRGVALQLPRAAPERDKLLQRIAIGKPEVDWLLLENSDVVTGELVGIAPAASDAAATHDSVAIKVAGDLLRAPRDKIAAISLAASAAPVDAPEEAQRVWLGFDDGSRLLATRVESQADRLIVTLACGAQLQTSRAPFFDALTLIQPLGPNVDYLSDLPGFGYKHVPFLDLSWSYHADRNANGSLLRSSGALYLKGIGMHSASRLAYELGGKYRRFAAELALDEAAGDRGSVLFRVYTSGPSGELSEAFASDVIRGGAAPVPVSIDVSGAERLVLVVEYADRGDQLDYANWLDARLIR